MPVSHYLGWGVTVLQALKDIKDFEEFAHLLGYKTKSLSYILYKLADSAKYCTFSIPKASGGERQIDAPLEPLKTLQRRLAKLLYDCVAQIETDAPRPALSHGFRRGRSIITNARRHRNRRYVLNLDLSDFFPTFNFGRVRGFFMADSTFALHERTATYIAQIACRDGKLPQGSPCSPIIADIVAHILDVRLAKLAKKHRLTYSRYADDITFSTNQKTFPAEIATIDPDNASKWTLHKSLTDRIEKSGFAINPTKTRMQYRGSRQTVTGLTVNKTVNIRVEYYKTVRSMCHLLFRTGRYHLSLPKSLDANDEGNPQPPPILLDNLAPLEGMLNHVHHIKNLADPRDEDERKKKPITARKLYHDFLFYRSFVALKRPLIICEGKTDNIYLRHAIRRLTAFHPALGQVVDSIFKPSVALFRYSEHAHQILRLGGGSGDMKSFVERYTKNLIRYKHLPLSHPVILVIDNDDGAKDIFAIIKGKFGKTIEWKSKDSFYHITDNLYLVKTPEIGSKHISSIEDLFDKATLATKIDGKVFNKGNTAATASQYGKYVFAEKVVQAHANTINFSGFVPLLSRIVTVINSYAPPH